MNKEELKEKFEQLQCHPFEDRRSLTELECLRKYFLDISLTPIREGERNKLKEAKKIIRETIKLCEADKDCNVGRFWEPYEWRICSPDEEALKWKIVKFIWTIMRGWEKKEKHHSENYDIHITQRDLKIFEKELEVANQKP